MSKIKKLIDYTFATIFHFIPRNKHLWLTGKISEWSNYEFSPPDFFDNSKYFFLYLVNNTAEKVYWISSSKHEIELLKKYNLPYIKYGSLKSFFYTLRAKYFFHHYGVGQINSILQANSIQIDFWHGTPLKKIRYDVVPKKNKKMNFLARFIGIDKTEYLSSTSDYLSNNILARAFDLPLNQCINFGYPRTDILKLSKSASLEFCKKYTNELLPYIEFCSRFKKVFLYMPTWRDDDPDYFSKANIDFNRLNEKLKETDSVFFLKLHPLTKFSALDRYSNIFQIKNDVDIYPFLTYTDYLITDYSSIYFDYLLLDREIIFIPYDLDNYTKNRELYFTYDEITPGKKYSSFDEFIVNMNSIDTLDFSKERKQIKDLLIQNYNFDACEQIYKFFAGTK
jgi:CDP-glycerol glycerophosphotransferase (TagB/SpsB family)